MMFSAFTDGASRGNPGASGIGVIVRDPAGTVILELFGATGVTTNNVAEYTALLTLLAHAPRFACSRLVVHSDSELLVRQVNGSYKVKHPQLQVHYRQARQAIAALPFPVELVHVPREQNRDADRLANEGIDSGLPVTVRVGPEPLQV